MRIRKIVLGLAVAAFAGYAVAQDAKPQNGYTFTAVKECAITSVKNQNRSSTCWAFSGLGFIESELLRLGKGEYDFSEMFVVYNSMIDRATNYVRLHGGSSFAPGGSFYDVMYCLEHYGIVPEQQMPAGVMYGDTLPVHSELDAVASGFVNAIAKGSLKKLTPVWNKALAGIYDSYLGKCPETFTYNNKEYTPQSFAQSLGLKWGDYVSLTSFTHHPFYTQFALEIEDNWRGGLSWNLPLDELMAVIENAVNKGFPVAWGSDVSEPGFSRDGLALMPDAAKPAETQGSDMLRWTGNTPEARAREVAQQPELNITQEMRQEGYDNWQTTDDHGMLIFGLAKDQNGREYYMVKNSWGKSGRYKGVWYATKSFVAYKTINIYVHRDAIPKAIAKKIGL
jgi:aminopeptidase C